MSDLEILLEEIDLLREHIGSTIYRAKMLGDIEALEKIWDILDSVVGELPDMPFVK